MLSMADAATDRRAHNFKRFFEGAGWKVELLSIATKSARGPERFFEYDRALKRAARARSVDIVMACDLFSLSAARWMKLHQKAKLLLYDSREVYTELPNVARKPLAKWIWRWLERRGLQSTDLIIATGPRDIQAICDVHDFLPRSVLVRNLPWRAEIERDRGLLDRFEIPREARVAVYVGGIQHGRTLRKLIEIFRELPDRHLLLIGDGELKKAMEAAVPPNVHFAGAMPSEDALRVVAACDIGISLIEPISPSYALALPSKLFEYMMCGIPVVSSRLEQVTDLFANEDWITFVDVNDLRSIRDGIETALANSRNSALRERERSIALTEYHFEHDAEKLLTLMEQL